MVTPLLRGAEIDACVHRITLARAEPGRAPRTPMSPEIERRRHEAEQHRRDVFRRLIDLHPGAVVASGPEHTARLIDQGIELILDARLAQNFVASSSPECPSNPVNAIKHNCLLHIFQYMQLQSCVYST